MTKRRVLAMLACGVLTAGLLTGCGGSSSDTAGADDAEITVVSREDGSGTRGAFVELFGVQDEDDKGEKTDMTTEDATITSSTEVVMTTVAGNKNAIGYCTLPNPRFCQRPESKFIQIRFHIQQQTAAGYKIHL